MFEQTVNNHIKYITGTDNKPMSDAKDVSDWKVDKAGFDPIESPKINGWISVIT